MAASVEEEAVKYINFIAETKGSLDSLNIRKVEEINCARKLYAALSTEKLKYDIITDYTGLLNIVK